MSKNGKHEKSELNKKKEKHNKKQDNNKEPDLEELKEELQKEIEEKQQKGITEKFSFGVEDIEPEEPKTEKEKQNVENCSESKRRKKHPIRKIILRLLQIIFLVIIIFSGIEIIKWNGDNQKTQEILEDISQSVIQEEITNEAGEIETVIKVDFEKLKEMNSDTVAWIKVNNTNVEYPIVQTEDNDYYLTHSFDKSYSKAGWIFADYRNILDGTDRNLIVYGHNRMDGSMFASLEQCLEEDWQAHPENKAIRFMTENEEAIYEIFSIYEVEDEEFYIRTDFYDDESYQSFLNVLKRRSYYDFGIEPTAEDKILTLSTCTNYNNGRIVIHARKVNNDIEIIEPEAME